MFGVDLDQLEYEVLESGLDGFSIDKKLLPKIGDTIVAIDPRYFRPTEVESLVGNAIAAQQQLGWKPGTSFEELVAEMVKADLQLAVRERVR